MAAETAMTAKWSDVVGSIFEGQLQQHSLLAQRASSVLKEARRQLPDPRIMAGDETLFQKLPLSAHDALKKDEGLYGLFDALDPLSLPDLRNVGAAQRYFLIHLGTAIAENRGQYTHDMARQAVLQTDGVLNDLFWGGARRFSLVYTFVWHVSHYREPQTQLLRNDLESGKLRYDLIDMAAKDATLVPGKTSRSLCRFPYLPRKVVDAWLQETYFFEPPQKKQTSTIQAPQEEQTSTNIEAPQEEKPSFPDFILVRAMERVDHLGIEEPELSSVSDFLLTPSASRRARDPLTATVQAVGPLETSSRPLPEHLDGDASAGEGSGAGSPRYGHGDADLARAGKPSGSHVHRRTPRLLHHSERSYRSMERGEGSKADLVTVTSRRRRCQASTVLGTSTLPRPRPFHRRRRARAIPAPRLARIPLSDTAILTMPTGLGRRVLRERRATPTPWSIVLAKRAVWNQLGSMRFREPARRR
ncbi:hypothetical protein ACQY0O_004600 [Thecaphora frezii]